MDLNLEMLVVRFEPFRILQLALHPHKRCTKRTENQYRFPVYSSSLDHESSKRIGSALQNTFEDYSALQIGLRLSIEIGVVRMGADTIRVRLDDCKRADRSTYHGHCVQYIRLCTLDS